jgi:hypothetical protein
MMQIRNQIIAETFSISWFITFFISELYLETSVKIFDLYLLDGWKQILKIALALLSQLGYSNIDYDTLLTKLKNLTKNQPLDDV